MEAIRLLHSARGFHRAQAVLLEEAFQRGNTEVLTAGVVCGAFSLELYLKCLILLDCEFLERTQHNYKILFEMLRPETQQKLRDAYASAPKSPLEEAVKLSVGVKDLDHSFDAVLAASQDAFVKMRYIFEGKFKHGEGFRASRVTNACIKVIEEFRPDWFSDKANIQEPQLKPAPAIDTTHLALSPNYVEVYADGWQSMIHGDTTKFNLTHVIAPRGQAQIPVAEIVAMITMPTAIFRNLARYALARQKEEDEAMRKFYTTIPNFDADVVFKSTIPSAKAP